MNCWSSEIFYRVIDRGRSDQKNYIYFEIESLVFFDMCCFYGLLENGLEGPTQAHVLELGASCATWVWLVTKLVIEQHHILRILQAVSCRILFIKVLYTTFYKQKAT